MVCFLAMSFVAAGDSGTRVGKDDISSINTERDFKVRAAVVDVQSVLEGSLAVQNVRKVVQEINHKINHDITQKEQELKLLEEKLVEQRPNMKEEAFATQVNAFNAKVKEFKKEIQDRKAKLDRAHSTSMGQIYEAMTIIMGDVAEKYHLNLVIPTTQVLYTKNNLNVTSEVISLLNGRLQSVVVDYED